MNGNDPRTVSARAKEGDEQAQIPRTKADRVQSWRRDGERMS